LIGAPEEILLWTTPAPSLPYRQRSEMLIQMPRCTAVTAHLDKRWAQGGANRELGMLIGWGATQIKQGSDPGDRHCKFCGREPGLQEAKRSAAHIRSMSDGLAL